MSEIAASSNDMDWIAVNRSFLSTSTIFYRYSWAHEGLHQLHNPFGKAAIEIMRHALDKFLYTHLGFL